MLEKLDLYIKENFEEERVFKHVNKERMACSELCFASNINTYIDENKDEDFNKLLFKYIDERNLTDSEVYNKVHIDRRLFSKIRSNNEYHPSKETVLLLGLSLELNEDEILELLDSAAYTLPKNNNYDLIMRFCFKEGIYKLKDVNELLAAYNCKLFNY